MVDEAKLNPVASRNPFEAMADYFYMVDKLQSALVKIACFGDEGANGWLRATGSYSRFDEPGSVEIARNALKEAGITGE